MESASAFNIYLPFAAFSPALRAAVIPCLVYNMQVTPVAFTSNSVLSFELLFTTIISTARLVMFELNGSNVRRMFFSSLYAGITTDTSGSPLCSVL